MFVSESESEKIFYIEKILCHVVQSQNNWG